jgi:hypothetical protein
MRHIVLVILFGTLSGMSAENSAADREQFVIRKRNATPETGARVWLESTLKDNAYNAQALEIAKLLAKEKPGYEDLPEIAQALRREPERAAKTFARFLDFEKFDPATRIGSIRALEISESKSAAVGKALAGSAIAEPVAQIRTAAIELIRKRRDAAAANEILRFWRGSFDSDIGFDEPKRLAAVNAMRDIGDRRIFEAMLAYVTLEIRAGATTSAGVGTANITGPGPINLPIDLPALDTMSVQGTIMVPAASSLKQATGQDFGKNVAKWRDWIAQQPDFKK